jgi:ribose 5-phosphate isomerase B
MHTGLIENTAHRCRKTNNKMETLKNISAVGRREMMRIGIATDFGWFELKRKLIEALNAVGYELADIGIYELVAGENYPDFVVPLGKSVSDKNNKADKTNHVKGIKACKAANKIPGVCAALIVEPFTPCKEVEDEDLFVRCLGGQVKGYALSKKKVMTFLNADCSTNMLSNQRLAKVRVLNRDYKMSERKRHLA